MKLCFISDTHSDKLLKSGTSPETRKKLRKLRQGVALTVLEKYADTEDSYIIHAGDLFNGKGVPDVTGLTFGVHVANECNLVVSGNHDISNQRDNVSVFQFLQELEDVRYKLVIAPFGTSYLKNSDTAKVVIVPHVLNQELFEESINDACKIGNANHVLVLHCNILLPDNLCTPTTLNLTQELMDKVSANFARVFVGHNHNYKEYAGGKVISIGTHYPSSFSDLDKMGGGFGSLVYDTITNKVTREVTHPPESVYRAMTTTEVLENSDVSLPPFIRIHGEYDPSVDFSELLLRCYAHGALAVKLDQNKSQIGLASEEEDVMVVDRDGVTSEDLTESILALLPTHIAEIVKQYLPK